MKKWIPVAVDVFFYSSLAFFLAVSAVMLMRRCDGQTKSDALSQEQDMQLEQILEEMRHDPVLIHQLDSMAELCVGKGARTMDYIQHTVEWQGRKFHVNSDWGDVMELPMDWNCYEDKEQVSLSYHGSGCISPDTLGYIIYRSGYNDRANTMASHKDELSDYVSVLEILPDSIEWTTMDLGGDSLTVVCTMTGRLEDDENIIFKFIFHDPYSFSHILCFRWYDGAPNVDEVRRYVRQFPLGPAGQIAKGMCRQFSRYNDD